MASDRDWKLLTDPAIGDPLKDIADWMLPPFTPGDIRRREEEKRKAMEERR